MKPSELLEQREQEVLELGNVYPAYYHDEFGTLVVLKAKHTKNGRKRDEHLASGESRRKTHIFKDKGLVAIVQDENDEVMGEAIALGRALKMYHKLYPEPKKILTVSGDMSVTWITPNQLTLR